MTLAEILGSAGVRGFQVSLNHNGDGLILWPDDPPADLVDLIRAAKPQIVVELRKNAPAARRWRKAFGDNLATILRIRHLPLLEAERAAHENTLIEFLNDDFPRHSDPNSCLWCHRSEEPGSALVQLGYGGRGAWLHRDPCADEWRNRRRIEAIAKLAEMGIVRPS